MEPRRDSKTPMTHRFSESDVSDRHGQSRRERISYVYVEEACIQHRSEKLQKMEKKKGEGRGEKPQEKSIGALIDTKRTR